MQDVYLKLFLFLHGCMYLRLLLQNIHKCLTTSFRYTCRGLFERHKLLFSFQMCSKILQAAGKLNMDEYNFFLRGGVVWYFIQHVFYFSYFGLLRSLKKKPAFVLRSSIEKNKLTILVLNCWRTQLGIIWPNSTSTLLYVVLVNFTYIFVLPNCNQNI